MPANGGNSLRFELGVRDAQALATNFRKRSDVMLDQIRDAVVRNGEETRDEAYKICPVDTSFMRDHIETVYSPDGFAYDTGWRADDFLKEGKPFYPWFVTQGTRFMAARPVLEPVFRITKAQLREDIKEILRRGGR